MELTYLLFLSQSPPSTQNTVTPNIINLLTDITGRRAERSFIDVMTYKIN